MIWKNNSYNEVMNGLKPLYPRLWRYCLVLTGNRPNADDLAQSTCLRAIEKSKLYKTGTKFEHWIFRMAQRLWLNELRSQAVRRGNGLSVIEEIDLPSLEVNTESNLFAREVLLEVLALPEAQRTTVFLVYVEGQSYKQAAEILDIPIGTVMSRLAVARKKLSDKFKPADNSVDNMSNIK